MVAASTLLLNVQYKASVFFTNQSRTPIFFPFKILPMERSSDTQKLEKKIINQILVYISYYSEIRAHLGNLFA